jgi:hypothetical protein
MSLGAGNPQLSARFFYLAGTHNNDPQATAVKMGNARNIKNDLLLPLFQEFRRQPFDLLAFRPVHDLSYKFH